MTRKLCNTRNLAFVGAILDIVLGIVQEVSEPFRLNLDASEPFLEALGEVFGFAVACALLSAATAWFLNRAFRV